jgi:hypothetical protein
MKEKVKCQFCGKEMERCTSYLGSGLNMIGFHCECGSMAVFCNQYDKKIKSLNVKCEYEEL